MEIYKFTAPSAWASYLFNGDSSGLEDSDIRACDRWIDRLNLGDPVDCEEAGFLRYHDASYEMNLAADCQTYTFLEQVCLVPSDSP